MFITDILDEMNIGNNAYFQSDVKMWKRVDTSEPYFQLTEKRSVDGGTEEVVVFIADPYELRRVVRTARARGQIGQGSVMVSTPGHINGTAGWSHDILIVMYLGIHKIRQEISIIYVTDRGVYGSGLDDDLGMYIKEILYITPDQPIDLFDHDIYRIGS